MPRAANNTRVAGVCNTVFIQRLLAGTLAVLTKSTSFVKLHCIKGAAALSNSHKLPSPVSSSLLRCHREVVLILAT